MRRKIVFSDLDGTLLDFSSYSYQESLEAVNMLLEKSIPIVFCSSKTRGEQEEYRRALSVCDPFIVEGGGAIFIPRDYFPFPFSYSKVIGDYLVIELGIPYDNVRKVLKMIEREVGCRIRGFGDMSVEEIADDSGLDVKFARLAKQRQYNETFKFEGTEEERETVLRRIEEEGFRYTRGGRYYQVMGGKGDKGKATRMLVELFREKFVEIETIGIGDSTSDIPMLAEVDMPILVQGPGGWWEKVGLPGVYYVEGVGPAGWSKATKELIVDSR